MPTIINDPPRTWKKDEWKSFHPNSIKGILWVRQEKIKEMQRVAYQEGVAAIYPSDDDDLDWKERPYA